MESPVCGIPDLLGASLLLHQVYVRGATRCVTHGGDLELEIMSKENALDEYRTKWPNQGKPPEPGSVGYPDVKRRVSKGSQTDAFDVVDGIVVPENQSVYEATETPGGWSPFILGIIMFLCGQYLGWYGFIGRVFGFLVFAGLRKIKFHAPGSLQCSVITFAIYCLCCGIIDSPVESIVSAFIITVGQYFGGNLPFPRLEVHAGQVNAARVEGENREIIYVQFCDEKPNHLIAIPGSEDSGVGYIHDQRCAGFRFVRVQQLRVHARERLPVSWKGSIDCFDGTPPSLTILEEYVDAFASSGTPITVVEGDDEEVDSVKRVSFSKEGPNGAASREDPASDAEMTGLLKRVLSSVDQIQMGMSKLEDRTRALETGRNVSSPQSSSTQNVRDLLDGAGSQKIGTLPSRGRPKRVPVVMVEEEEEDECLQTDTKYSVPDRNLEEMQLMGKILGDAMKTALRGNRGGELFDEGEDLDDEEVPVLKGPRGSRQMFQLHKSVSTNPKKWIKDTNDAAMRALGVTTHQPWTMAEYGRRRVNFGNHRGLERMWMILCNLHELMRRGEATVAEASVCQALKCIEETVKNNGDWQTGWSWTGLPEPDSSAAGNRGLANPAEFSVAQSYIKELDAVEKRRKERRERRPPKANKEKETES